MPISWSPSTTSPCSSRPRIGRRRRRARSRCPRSTAATARAACSGAVAPQSRLMLMPSGSLNHAPVGAGAGQDLRRDMPPEPLAQSITIRPLKVNDRGERHPMVDVAAEQVVYVSLRPRCVVVRADQLVGTEQVRLEFVLDHVIELEATSVDHLEAVVAGRVVRGGNHHAGAVAAFGGQQRQRRRGAHAEPVDIDAERHRPGGDGRDEHVSRAAGVLADQESPLPPSRCEAVARPRS